MAWSEINTDDVLSEFNDTEKDKLQELQADTQRLTAILGRTVAAFRGAIAGGGSPVGEDGTLPDQVIPDVIAIARWRWLLSIPKSETLQSEERQKLNDTGEERLQKIESGELKVERPAGPASGLASPSIGKKHRTFRSRSEDGL